MPIILVVMTGLPQPSGDFEWVQAPWGAALRCRPLEAIAPHYFTTRELSLEGVRDDDAGSWQVLSRAMGVEIDGLVRMRQVHGAKVHVAERGVPTPFSAWPEADIAVSDDPSVVISVRAADCVPALLADRHGRAVAAVHAGWRGTAAGAVIAAVRALEERFDTKPADVVAAVGPSIGACCYEVGADLPGHFSAHPDAPRWFSGDARPRLDLWRATRDQLTRAGVPAQQVHVAALCTFDHPALLHSYRRDGARAGRLVAAIRSARGRTP
jgi:YfiH family protein